MRFDSSNSFRLYGQPVGDENVLERLFQLGFLDTSESVRMSSSFWRNTAVLLFSGDVRG